MTCSPPSAATATNNNNNTNTSGQGQGQGQGHGQGYNQPWNHTACGWTRQGQNDCRSKALKKFAFLGLFLAFMVPCITWKLIALAVAFQLLPPTTFGNRPRPLRLFLCVAAFIFFPWFRWLVFGTLMITLKSVWFGCGLYGAWSLLSLICKWKQINCRCNCLMKHVQHLQHRFQEYEQLYRLYRPERPNRPQQNSNAGSSPDYSEAPTQTQQHPPSQQPQHQQQTSQHEQSSSAGNKSENVHKQAPSQPTSQSLYPPLPPYSSQNPVGSVSNPRVKID